MNAADLLLVTSFSETGPLIVKEAIACNCPVVSTDVGNVREVISDKNNSYITSYNAKEIEDAIKKILRSKDFISNTKIDLQEHSLNRTALKIKEVYQKTLKNNDSN